MTTTSAPIADPYPNSYQVGQAVRFQAIPIDVNGIPTTSPTITCSVSLPDGTTITPAVSSETLIDVNGNPYTSYFADVVIAGTPALAVRGGVGSVHWSATGTPPAANASRFRRFVVLRSLSLA